MLLQPRQLASEVPFTYPPVSFLTLKDYLTTLVNANGGVLWPLDDAAFDDPPTNSKPHSYNRVINPAVAVGRELLLTPDFATDTNWSKGTGWTISGGAAHAAAAVAGQNLTSSSAAPVVIGRAYQVTFTILNYTLGSIKFFVGGASAATTRSSNGTFTETLIASSTTITLNPQTTFTGDIDNVSVKELNIPASTAVPSQLLNTDVWNNLGTAAWTGVGATLSAQTVTRHDGNSGTVLQLVRNATAPNYATASLTLTAGQAYRAYGWVLSTNTGIPTFYNGTTALKAGVASASIVGWQYIDTSFVAVATDFRLGNSSNTAGSTVQFDLTVVSLDNFINRETNLLQDGDMEKIAANTSWQAANGGVLSKQAGAHDGSLCFRVASNGAVGDGQQGAVLVTGHRYWISGWWRGDGGTGTPVIASVTATIASSGITANTWTAFSVVFTAADSTLKLRNSTITNTTYAEFDTVVLVELSPLVGIPTNGVIMGVAETSRLLVSETYDGVNDLTNLYSPQFNSIWNPDEGAIGVYFKMSSAGIWTDGTLHALMYVGLGGGVDVYRMNKTTVNNQIGISFQDDTGNYGVAVTAPTTGTLWHLIMVTWSRSGNFVKLYYDGLLVATGPGNFNSTAWNANLGSTRVLVGAGVTTGAQPHSGSLSLPFFIGRAVVAEEAAEMAKLGDVA